MSTIEFAFEGITEKLKHMVELKNEARNHGLWVGAEYLLGQSNEMVPHEEGDLEASGAVSQDEADGTTAISYDTDYAVVQHEDMSLHHDEGRQAKFLETAMTRDRANALAIVRNVMREDMKL